MEINIGGSDDLQFPRNISASRYNTTVPDAMKESARVGGVRGIGLGLGGAAWQRRNTHRIVRVFILTCLAAINPN